MIAKINEQENTIDQLNIEINSIKIENNNN